MIFPYRGSSYSESIPGLNFIAAKDGTRLATRFWEVADLSQKRPLVLYFHGNAEDLGHLDAVAQRLGQLGFPVLAMDYRGYGLSGGTVSEANCYADAQVLLNEATRLGYQSENLLLWGRSVGSGTAVQVATTGDFYGLVLDSPFVSAFRVATKIPILPFDKFPNLKRMPEITEPFFILHGAQDTLIPPWHSEKLYQAHPGPKKRLLVEGAGHNDLWSHLTDELLQLTKFFETCERQ